VLVGFTRQWPHERGRLRVLRSNDRNDYAFEFAPEFGRMLMFRVCDHSWHGFLPQKGQRMSLQLCYVDSELYARKEYWRHSISAYAKSVPLLRKVIDWAPRRLPGAVVEVPPFQADPLGGVAVRPEVVRAAQVVVVEPGRARRGRVDTRRDLLVLRHAPSVVPPPLSVT